MMLNGFFHSLFHLFKKIVPNRFVFPYVNFAALLLLENYCLIIGAKWSSIPKKELC